MTTTWAVMIDWDRNANYGGAYDDISSRVIDAQWFLGMDKPYQYVADDSKLTLTLDNTDGRFSPENSASPLNGRLKPLRPITVISNDGLRSAFVGGLLGKVLPTYHEEDVL